MIIRPLGLRKMSSLVQCISAFQQLLRSSTPVHVAVGNEAADADSVVSSIARACLSEKPAVALLQVKRAELPLRRDVLWLLEAALAHDSASLSLSQGEGRRWKEADIVNALPCVEDWDGRLSSPISSLTLLDHNSIQPKGPVARLHAGPTATAMHMSIVDHHQDMGELPAVQGEARRIAYDTGASRGIASTCTLLAEDALGWPYHPYVHGQEEGRGMGQVVHSHPALTPGLAYCLLGVILLDSQGLDPAAGKVTERDRRAAMALQQHLLATLPASTPSAALLHVHDLHALYSTLQGLKSDPAWWSTLPLPTALAYDRKTFPGYSASSVLVDLCRLLAQDLGQGAGTAALRDGLAQEDVHFLLLMSMTVGEDGAPRRQLAIVRDPSRGAGSEAQAQRALAALRHPSAGLQLQALEFAFTGEELKVDLFQQGNVKASRKQVVPIIQQALVQ